MVEAGPVGYPLSFSAGLVVGSAKIGIVVTGGRAASIHGVHPPSEALPPHIDIGIEGEGAIGFNDDDAALTAVPREGRNRTCNREVTTAVRNLYQLDGVGSGIPKGTHPGTGKSDIIAADSRDLMKLKHPCRADAGDVSVRCAISYIDGSPLSLVEEDAIADAERRGVVHGDGSWVYESCYRRITIDDAA
jgi:hypothetical protein